MYSAIKSLLSRTLFPDELNENVAIIRELHHYVMFYAVVIFFFVSYIMVSTYVEHDVFAYGKRGKRYAFGLRQRMFNSRHASHSPNLEIFWTLVPGVILIAIAVPSFIYLYLLDDIYFPEITIKAIGHQWYWSYEYTDYPYKILLDSFLIYESALKRGELRLLEVTKPLIIPHGIDIRLIATSLDVLHSFSIPSLGIKIDAVPGRLNQVPMSVDLNYVGVFYGQCSELCGVNHGFMPIKLIVCDFMDYIGFLKSANQAN